MSAAHYGPNFGNCFLLSNLGIIVRARAIVWHMSLLVNSFRELGTLYQEITTTGPFVFSRSVLLFRMVSLTVICAVTHKPRSEFKTS